MTAERLLNATSEPQNWLIVHHDYNNSRHSPLSEVNAENAKQTWLVNNNKGDENPYLLWQEMGQWMTNRRDARVHTVGRRHREGEAPAEPRS